MLPPTPDTILQGDALATLQTLPDGCVHCVVTSPPYWGLRDYGVAGQLGLEATPDEYVARMVAIFREVRRVLRDDGTLWLNLGDSYASNWPCNRRSVIGAGSLANGKREARPPRMGGHLKDKDLIGIPWLVAFALRADGWYLRSDIIWHKPNPMPESVRDRPTKAHEYLFLLSKQERYYYDADAIREPLAEDSMPRILRGRSGTHKWADGGPGNHTLAKDLTHACNPAGRNARTVWTVATAPYSGAHFATFPPKLIEPCILAGTSPRCCEHCGAPWARVVARELLETKQRKLHPSSVVRMHAAPLGYDGGVPKAVHHTIGWRPTCRCEHNTGSARAVVFDPFMGSGTVGAVARRRSRHYLGIELNPDYIALAEERIAKERQPVLWTA